MIKKEKLKDRVNQNNMQISQKLPQFKKTPTLIITAGWQSGKIYYAHKGKIVLDKKIEVSRQYSDKEGYFETKAGTENEAIKSGAPYENKKKHLRDKFLKKTTDYLNKIVHDNKIESIYLFSSQEGLKSFKENLPRGISKLITKSYKGNYIYKKPNELLGILKNKKSKPVQVMKEEAKKIMDKTKRFFSKK